MDDDGFEQDSVTVESDSDSRSFSNSSDSNSEEDAWFILFVQCYFLCIICLYALQYTTITLVSL